MKLKFLMIVGLLAVIGATNQSVLFAGEAPETTLYVSTVGNDAWSGSLPNPNAAHSDGPLATLDGARLAVRKKIANGLTQPITVLIRGGEYPLESTVVFGLPDAGTKEFPIIYQAYPNEKPVFTGAKKLTDWKPCTNDPPGTPAVAKGKLWMTEIPENLRGSWFIKSLYDGLTLLPRSRSGVLYGSDVALPNDKHDQLKKISRELKTTDAPLVFSRDFAYRGNDLNTASDPRDLEIFMSPRYTWLINMLPVESIDFAHKIARFTIVPTYQPLPGNPYYVDNAIEYLNQPGEWIFESKTGRVYLWPKQPLDKSDIRAPFLKEFIRVEGVEDQTPLRFVNFVGLTFHYGLRDTVTPEDQGLQHDWEMYDKGNAVLRFRQAEDCKVDSCAFTASSGGGVRLDLHCEHITVENSLFSYLGGPGIVLSGYGPGFKDENRENTVENNLIHHVGEIYWQSPAIFIAQSGHNLVRNNTIHDLGYNGIVVSGCRTQYFVYSKPYANNREWVKSIRFKEAASLIDKGIADKILDINYYEPLLHARENHIEENEIYRVMLRLHDGDAIYLSAMGKDNHVERNYIHDVQNSSGAIRMDDQSTFTYIDENVVADCNAFVCTTAMQELRNNFAINDRRYVAQRGPIASDRNIFYDNDPHQISYLAGKRGEAPVDFYKLKIFKSINSLYYAVSPPPGVHPGEDLCPPGSAAKGEVGLLFADPLFDQEAMKQRIFRFEPGSPTEKLGIKPLDMSHAGSSLTENGQLK